MTRASRPPFFSAMTMKRNGHSRRGPAADHAIAPPFSVPNYSSPFSTTMPTTSVNDDDMTMDIYTSDREEGERNRCCACFYSLAADGMGRLTPCAVVVSVFLTPRYENAISDAYFTTHSLPSYPRPFRRETFVFGRKNACVQWGKELMYMFPRAGPGTKVTRHSVNQPRLVP